MGCLFINGAYAGWVIIQDDIVLVSYGYDLDGKTFEEKEANVKEEYREKCRDIYIKFSRSDTVFSAIAWTIFYFPYVLISCYFILGRLIRNVEGIKPEQINIE